jgi:hypothetical protein
MYYPAVCKGPSLAFLILMGSASVLLAGPAAYKGPDPCALATEGDSPVDKACREGGIKAAKVAMKDLLREGRKAGVKHECDDCHIADDDYTKLTAGAEEKFTKLLNATRKQQKP